jgi:hypothetical protein
MQPVVTTAVDYVTVPRTITTPVTTMAAVTVQRPQIVTENTVVQQPTVTTQKSIVQQQVTVKVRGSGAPACADRALNAPGGARRRGSAACCRGPGVAAAPRPCGPSRINQMPR